jgi:hypothetical protein
VQPESIVLCSKLPEITWLRLLTGFPVTFLPGLLLSSRSLAARSVRPVSWNCQCFFGSDVLGAVQDGENLCYRYAQYFSAEE